MKPVSAALDEFIEPIGIHMSFGEARLTTKDAFARLIAKVGRNLLRHSQRDCYAAENDGVSP
jgi:hypothetical protein